MSPHPTEDVQYETSGAGAAWIVLGGVMLLATLLGVLFYVQYSRTMVYVKATLDEPTEPLPWDERPLSAGECVDEAMAWASECRGVKAMCDMYVDHAIALCMRSQDRTAYCETVIVEAETARFGSAECRMRGVQRNVDAEACANAYKAILSYCESWMDLLPSEGSGAGADPGTATGEGASTGQGTESEAAGE